MRLVTVPSALLALLLAACAAPPAPPPPNPGARPLPGFEARLACLGPLWADEVEAGPQIVRRIGAIDSSVGPVLAMRYLGGGGVAPKWWGFFLERDGCFRQAAIFGPKGGALYTLDEKVDLGPPPPDYDTARVRALVAIVRGAEAPIML